MIDAGKLDQRVEVLALQESPEGWAWTPVHRTWAAIETEAGRTLFSSVGLGANAAGLTLRWQKITLDHAIRWNGQHCFLTAVTAHESGRNWMKVKAAIVELTQCAFAGGDGGRTFPAVLTEKYVRHEQDMPMARNALTYVLVTPKAVTLTPGHLVDVGGQTCHVLTGHILDPHKNEYEILRECDL